MRDYYIFITLLKINISFFQALRTVLFFFSIPIYFISTCNDVIKREKKR